MIDPEYGSYNPLEKRIIRAQLCGIDRQGRARLLQKTPFLGTEWDANLKAYKLAEDRGLPSHFLRLL